MNSVTVLQLMILAHILRLMAKCGSDFRSAGSHFLDWSPDATWQGASLIFVCVVLAGLLVFAFLERART